MKKPLLSPPADRLDLLHTFVRIVEAGSMSAAASQLGTTQPTVSRRLQALERELGTKLLHRSTHSMNLTPDGQRCFEHAKDLVAHWTSLQATARGVRDEPEGTLRVLVPHAFGQDQLIGLLHDYLSTYPRVRVDWSLHDRTPNFSAEDVDCALHVGEQLDPSVIALKLTDVPRMIVASPALLAEHGQPSTPAELARLPWIALSTFYRRDVTLTHRTTAEVQRIRFEPRLATDSLYALRGAVMRGIGVCLGSAWLLRQHIATGELVQLLPEWQVPSLPMHLIYPPARFYPARLRCFIDLARQQVQAAVAAVATVEPPARPASQGSDISS